MDIPTKMCMKTLDFYPFVLLSFVWEGRENGKGERTKSKGENKKNKENIGLKEKH